MSEEKNRSTLSLNSPLDGPAYWLPLIPFTIPTGVYPIGRAGGPDRPFLFIGNSRRQAQRWRRALAGMDFYLVVVDTGAQPLAAALAASAVAPETLANSVFPAVQRFRERAASPESEPAPPSLFLPLAPDQVDLLDAFEALTGVPARRLPPVPSAAAEILRAGRSEDQAPPLEADQGKALRRDIYPLAFNLALFMSLFTFGLSWAFASDDSWLWFLLPWAACIGVLFPPQLPGLVRGVLWGLALSLFLGVWQVAVAGWAGAVSWSLAALLICVWAGQRLDSPGYGAAR